MKPKQDKVLVVEVEKAQRVPALTADVAKSIGTLQSHPGFLYLLAKCKFQKQLLKSTLEKRQATMEDIILLQSGIAWSAWLQNELDTAIGFEQATPTAPLESELSIFEESQRQLEVLR